MFRLISSLILAIHLLPLTGYGQFSGSLLQKSRSASEDYYLSRDTLPITGSRTLPCLDVTLNGKGPYRFLIDLGSNVVNFKKSVAEEAGLELVVPRDQGTIAMVRQLTFGGNVFLNVYGAIYDDLDVEDFHITGEQLRQIEANLAAQHIERWTFYVQERATKKLAGYTELTFVPDRLAMANQGDTGVFPEFRGRGLGRWLKAAMLAKVLAERPSVQFVRTGNADSNAAMLKINREMGFRPYMSQTIWQIETAKVKAYLEGK